jgi:hypothetical protein
MTDRFGADIVEITISEADGLTRIWVHVDGKLVDRVYRIKRLVLDDRRKPRPDPESKGC